MHVWNLMNLRRYDTGDLYLFVGSDPFLDQDGLFRCVEFSGKQKIEFFWFPSTVVFTRVKWMKFGILNLWNTEIKGCVVGPDFPWIQLDYACESGGGIGHEYVGADMLEPREADVPVLILVLVVLPLVTYILLGKWSEAAKKKARISMLAQLAAEEAFRVESVSSLNVIPAVTSPKVGSKVGTKVGSYECARCFAPATTRCSRCKSVRYCSGKCQIVHWRQGHKLECQQWQDSSQNLSFSIDSVRPRPLLDNSMQFLGNDIEEPPPSDLLSDISSDASFTTADALQDSASERKSAGPEKQFSNRHKKETSRGGVSRESEHTSSYGAEPPTLGTGNFTPSYEVYRSEDIIKPTNGCGPSDLKTVTHQSLKSTGETRNVLKPNCFLGNSENVISECETGPKFTSDGGCSSVSETLDLNSSAEDVWCKGSIMYKRPPYILESTTSLCQQSAEKKLRDYQSHGVDRTAYINNESRANGTNASTSVPSQSCNGISNMGAMKMAGSKKSSKGHKLNLIGLTSDYNRNKMLFPYEDLVKFFQCEVWGISPRGLLNCGNSCYANAVLQCLTCTKPLMVYLLRRSHSNSCRVRNWCLMCELEQHVSMMREGGGPLSPSRILSNMRNIGCRMGGGNQEDAHEFLRLVVMSMQSICLDGLGGEKEVNPSLQETTLIQQIFGGRLRSKVKCLRCHHESERYENIMDLTLEIHGWVESLEDALTQFTAPEDLDGENMYRCGRCSAYVKARKQLSVHEVPNILTIVLKRFQSGKYGKINKCVTFPDMLDMIPFVTGTADSPPLYTLYGVVVHLDTLNASFSGHYVSYVKDLQGAWFRIDDSEVQAVPLGEVMSEGAYMLFYSRSFPRPPRAYIEKAQLQASNKHAAAPRPQKTSKHGQHKQNGPCIDLGNSVNGIDGYRSSSERFADSISMDFSDATSSDWSLFTSSDESSFTTESTRDSFSTVDHGDAAGLDPISSIFAPPFYVPEYPHSNTISCTKFSPCRPVTRFFSERRDFVLDSSLQTRPPSNVHKGRN